MALATPTLNIVTSFSMIEQNGSIGIGYQGTDATLGINDPFPITITGPGLRVPFTLATATAIKLYDSAINFPAVFVWGMVVASQAGYLQFITSATNFIVPIAAGVPYVFAPTLLAAANTTAMAGTAPSVTAVAKIYVQNNSGNSMSGLFFLAN